MKKAPWSSMGPLLVSLEVRRDGLFPRVPERGLAYHRPRQASLLFPGNLLGPARRLLPCRVFFAGIRLAMAGSLLGNGAAAQQG